MFDLKVVEFKKRLVEEINESELPLSVIKYILTDIENMIGKALEKQLILDREEKEREIQNSQSFQGQDCVDGDTELIDVNMNE